MSSKGFFLFSPNSEFQILGLISSFFTNYERTLSAYFQFAQMDLARIRVLRTLINLIAKNLRKLQICLRSYSFYKKTRYSTFYKFSTRVESGLPKNRQVKIRTSTLFLFRPCGLPARTCRPPSLEFFFCSRTGEKYWNNKEQNTHHFL